jgi:hypothetical protein
MTTDEGQWPKAIRRFLCDFMTHERAPESDGIVAPEFEPPDWIDHVATLPGAIEVARSARKDAEDGAKTAEDKASRLVQVSLALLTVSLALGSYQLEFVLKRSWQWIPTLLPVGLALIFLALAAFEALQIDRVGMYSYPDGSELAHAELDKVSTLLLTAEVRGRRLASWSSRKKHNDLMQARAWFTRGLAALIIAGVVAGVGRASSEAQSSSRSHSQTVTTTTAETLGSDRSDFPCPQHDCSYSSQLLKPPT